MAFKVGMKFLHRRVLNEKNAPALYVVTKIECGSVYYKQPDEKKAKEWCEPKDFFRNVCLKIVED